MRPIETRIKWQWSQSFLLRELKFLKNWNRSNLLFTQLLQKITDSGKAINLACTPDPSQFPQAHMELFLFFIMISTKPNLNWQLCACINQLYREGRLERYKRFVLQRQRSIQCRTWFGSYILLRFRETCIS